MRWFMCSKCEQCIIKGMANLPMKCPVCKGYGQKGEKTDDPTWHQLTHKEEKRGLK